MKNNLTCEIVEDLMPSYIDGLTSEVTNKAVREHLSQCGKCNAKLDTMSEPYSEDKIEQEKQEIDFLKKNRRKNIRTKLISLLAVVLVVAVAVCTLPYGEKVNFTDDQLLYNLEVEGNTFRLTLIPKDKDMIITEINKVVYGIGSNESEYAGVTTPGDKDVTAVEVDGEKHDLLEKGVEVIGRKRTLFENYTKTTWEYTYEDIKTFKLEDTILWEDGEYISDITAKLFWLKPYQTKYKLLDDYADAIGLKNYIGAYEIKDKTKEDELKIHIINELMPQQAKEKESLMKKYSYVFLSMKPTINSVTFEYEIFNSDGDDKKCQVTTTRKRADKYFGDEIEKCFDDINELQKLMEMTGLTDLPYNQPDMFAMEADAWNMIYFRILNNSDADIQSIHMNWPDGDEGMGHGIERDNNFISFGHSQVNPRLYDFSLEKLSENLYDESRLGTTEFQISVYDFDGNEYILDETVEVSAQFGAVYYLVLDGTFEDGFTVKIK